MNKIITTGTMIVSLFFVVLLTGCSDPAEPEVAQEQAVPVAVDQTEVPVGLAALVRRFSPFITGSNYRLTQGRRTFPAKLKLTWMQRWH